MKYAKHFSHKQNTLYLHSELDVYFSVRQSNTVDHFTFWISLLLRLKTETKRLNFGLSRSWV